MKISRRKLRKLIEMAVRQDILDAAAAQPGKRTVLMGAALDVSKLKNIIQPHFGQGIKPIGLWYGFGTNWIDFVRNPDNKGLISKYTNPEYFYNIDVKTVTVDQDPDENSVLVLRNHDDLKKLLKAYPGFELKRIGGMFLANWNGVAVTYAGLEVSDRLASYCGWDVASGCVWNKNAITNVELLQSPETTENIPRGAAALGVNLSFNPDAQTIDEIGNQKLIEQLKEYEEDFEYPGAFEYELTQDRYADQSFYDNIYKKLFYMMSNVTDAQSRNYGSWYYDALNKNRPDEGNYSALGCAIWLLHHYNQNTNTVGGATSIIYDIVPDEYDLGDALDNTNEYLQNISDLYELGIKGIDLDHDNSWDYARSDIELAMSDY